MKHFNMHLFNHYLSMYVCVEQAMLNDNKGNTGDKRVTETNCQGSFVYLFSVLLCYLPVLETLSFTSIKTYP
jgi:hypothetical protein